MGVKKKIITFSLLIICFTNNLYSDNSFTQKDEWEYLINLIEENKFIHALDIIEKFDDYKIYSENYFLNYIYILNNLGKNGESIAVVKKGLYYNPYSKELKQIAKYLNDEYYEKIVSTPIYVKIPKYLYLVLLAFFNISLIVFFLLKKRKIVYIILILSSIFILMFGLTKYYPKFSKDGVVVSNTYLVKFPSQSSEKLFIAKLGTPIQIVYQYDHYFYIKHPEGYNGWIEKKYIKKVFDGS